MLTTNETTKIQESPPGAAAPHKHESPIQSGFQKNLRAGLRRDFLSFRSPITESPWSSGADPKQ